MKEENNKNESGSNKVVLAAIVFFLIGFGTAWMFAKPVEAPVDEVKEEVVNANIPLMSVNTVEVDDQKVGSTVFLKSIKFENAGWVAIHDNNEGVPGNILGAAWFPSGENSGLVELLRNTENGKTYFAMIRSDDGDKKFDNKIDVPITDASGAIIMAKFMTSETQAAQ